MLIIMTVVMTSQVYMYVKACRIVRCKYANYTGCQLYTNKGVFKNCFKEIESYSLPFVSYLTFQLPPTKRGSRPILFLMCSQSFVMIDTEISLFLLEVKKVFKLGHHCLPLIPSPFRML